MSLDDMQPVPLLLLTGFLGAGKTTLLSRLLVELEAKTKNDATQGHSSKGKPLLLVNDFSDANVDAMMLGRLEGEGEGNESSPNSRAVLMEEFSGGCICCTLLDEFITSLATKLDHHKEAVVSEGTDSTSTAVLSYIFVEATGLADPLAIVMGLLFHPELQRHRAGDGGHSATFTIDCVATMVDCGGGFHPETNELHQLQVTAACNNVVVMGKMDSLTKEKNGDATRKAITEIVTTIVKLNSKVSIVPAVFGNTGPAMYTPPSSSDGEENSGCGGANKNKPTSLLYIKAFQQQGTQQVLQRMKDAGWCDDGESEADKFGYRAVKYQGKCVFDHDKLLAVVESGAALHGVIRSKGYVAIAEKKKESTPPGTPAAASYTAPTIFLWSSVGRRFAYAPVVGVTDVKLVAKGIVLIGQDQLDEEVIFGALQSAEVSL